MVVEPFDGSDVGLVVDGSGEEKFADRVSKSLIIIGLEPWRRKRSA